MTNKKRGLGRGLDVLIKSRNVEPENEAEISSIPINSLRPNVHQPRIHFDQQALEELAASIRSQGLIQPILVRPLEIPGQYEIVAGERRWRASSMAGLEQVECIIRKMDDHESMAIALIENLQREDLNPMEEARALGQIKQHFDITQEELADKIGKSRPAVTNCLRLLKLPESVQQLLESNGLTAGHARALLSIEDDKAMAFLADMVATKRLTVRATEDLVKQFKNTKLTPSTPQKVQKMPDDLSRAGKSIEARYAFKIRCSGTADKGKISLSYASEKERLQIVDLLERMSREGE